jgi:hypothetical protein
MGYNKAMSKDKWLRVRLNDEQDEKLDRYSSVQGISRSDLIREIIDSMPTEPTAQKLELNLNYKTGNPHYMEITDKLGNRLLLSVDYRPNFNLWRIGLQKIGMFNILKFLVSVDLIKEAQSKDNEVCLNSINTYESEKLQELDQYVWKAIEELAEQENWSKIYGELTLEQVENQPWRLSWLKQKDFKIESQSYQQNLHFSLVLNQRKNQFSN